MKFLKYGLRPARRKFWSDIIFHAFAFAAILSVDEGRAMVIVAAAMLACFISGAEWMDALHDETDENVEAFVTRLEELRQKQKERS